MKNSNLPDKPTAFELSEVMASLASIDFGKSRVAQELGLHPSAVDHWVAGRNLITRQHWLDLCHLCQRHTHNDIASAVLAQLPHDEDDAKVTKPLEVARMRWDDLFDCKSTSCTLDCDECPENAPNAPETSIALEAHDIVNNRGEEAARMYGPFSEGMERAAMIFTGSTGIAVEGKHMYLALVALKLSRQSYNHKRDNLLDAIAYLQGLDNLENGKG